MFYNCQKTLQTCELSSLSKIWFRNIIKLKTRYLNSAIEERITRNNKINILDSEEALWEN